MLVLTRKTNEKIVIDGHIEVSVIQVRGDRVRIGIQAPDSISIERSEIARKLPELKQLPMRVLLGAGV
jgi:carbon storage regulator